MISQEEGEFYSYIKGKICEHPEWLLSAMQAIQSGTAQRLERERFEKSEWENLALNAMEGRLFKGNKGWIAQKIDRLRDNAMFRWDHIIERLNK